MTDPVIDSYDDVEEKIEKLKQELLNNFDQQLADFITLHLSDGQLDDSEPIEEIKHRCSAPTAVVNDLLTALNDILSLPNCKRLQQICDEAGCELLIGLQKLPCINEGFVLQRLSITIKRR